MARAWPVVVAVLGVALGVAAEWVSLAWGDPGNWIPDLAVGWTLIGCGLIAGWRRSESRVGWLLVGTGLTWFLGNFAAADLAVIAWIGAHAVYLHRGPLVQLLVTYPTGRSRSRLERGAIVGGYMAASITLIWRSEAATIVLAALLVAVCVYGYVRSVGRLRRARRIALLAASGLSLVLVATAMARLLLPPGGATGPSLLVYDMALCVIALSLTVSILVAPWERSAVADLVVELGEARSGTLRGQLSRALGDPTLEIGYWLSDRGIYVDGEGRPLIEPTADSGRSMTVLEREGQPVAALLHDPAVLDDSGLVEAATSAAQLAAANARLRAEVQAQAEELEASRRRLLEAGDEQRRRLERRLNDGAAARLHGLAVILRRGTRSAAGQRTKHKIARAEDQLQQTLEELRRLAHGLHPRVLSEQGLHEALTELVRDVPLPVDLEVRGGQPPLRVAAAAYFICAEALSNSVKHAAASRVTVIVGTSDSWLRVEIADDGVGGADTELGSGLRGLADRVETLRGTLELESVSGHGTRLAAEIPLDGEAW